MINIQTCNLFKYSFCDLNVGDTFRARRDYTPDDITLHETDAYIKVAEDEAINLTLRAHDDCVSEGLWIDIDRIVPCDIIFQWTMANPEHQHRITYFREVKNQKDWKFIDTKCPSNKLIGNVLYKAEVHIKVTHEEFDWYNLHTNEFTNIKKKAQPIVLNYQTALLGGASAEQEKGKLIEKLQS